MFNDVISKIEHYPTVEDRLNRLKIAYGDTSTTKLNATTRLNAMDLKDTMTKLLRLMLALIHDLKSTCNNIRDDQQILTTI